jgi:uncharacterized membrane protein YgcG
MHVSRTVRVGALGVLIGLLVGLLPPSASSQARVLLEEDFSRPSLEWPEFGDESVRFEYRDGGYRVVSEAGGGVALPTAVDESVASMRVEADVTQRKDAKGTELYGVACGLGELSSYTFFIGPDTRSYSIEQTDVNGIVVALDRGSRVKQMRRPPATNHLRADCRGGPATLLELSVNGTLVAKVEDPRGLDKFDRVELALGTGDTDVLFDNLVVRGSGFAPQDEAVGAAGEGGGGNDCASRVVDDANVLSPAMEAQATQAAAGLEAIGADPYVRFVRTYAPHASIDAYERALIRTCATYESENAGERKNNLVLLIVAMSERKAVLSWGERWNASLEDEADRVRADFLNPNLRDGEYGRAVVDTLGEVERLLEEQLHPSRGGGGLRTWAIVLSALVGLGLLVLAGVGAARYRRFTRKRAAAQAEAITRRDEATGAMTEMSTAHDELGGVVEIAKLQLGPEEVSELDDACAKATAAVDEAIQRYSALDGPEWDPERRHALEDFEKIAAAYRAAHEAASTAHAAIAETMNLASGLTKLAQELPREIEEVDTLLATASAARGSAAKVGYRVEKADDVIDRATSLLSQARAAVADKRLRAGEAAVADAQALARDAAAWCDGLPELRAGLERDAEALNARIQGLMAKTPVAKAVFEAIATAFAPDSWGPVRGNGSGAERCMAYASRAQAEAAEAATMERQEWEAARAAIENGNAAVNEAEKLLEAIHAMRQALEQAMANAPGEVEAAAADIAAARDYLRSHDRSIAEAREDELSEAEATLERARAELTEEMPNYLVVVKQASSANAAADQVLAACRSEVEQLERLKAKAVSALRDADIALSTAARYIDSHLSDVEAGTESKLAQAERNLAAAKAVTVAVRSPETAERDQREALEKKIELAEAAESDAELALKEAKRDVRSARRAPSRSDFWSSTFDSSTSYSSFSSGGGGGSSSGGGGGGGGGSSSGGW